MSSGGARGEDGRVPRFEERPTGDLPSGLDTALERIGDRWALLLVSALLEGPQRYSELQRRLPTIASNVLSARLRRLEESGVIQSERYSQRPPRFDYRLTREGMQLSLVVALLARWGGEPGELPLHDRCGTPLEFGLYCPSCGEPVPDGQPGGDDSELIFA